jgi:tellurite resistance protein TerC
MTNSIGTPAFWAIFLTVVLLLLSIDLGVFHRKDHRIGTRESLCWTVIWIALSFLFGMWIFARFGSQAGLEFFAGYLIEKSLSVDNIFVFILIFSYFAVPSKFHHRVLFYGVLGALFLRAAFILVGAALIHSFHWMLYLFGAFLVYVGLRIMCHGEAKVQPGHNAVVRLFQRYIPMTRGYQGGCFLVRRSGRILATPLALVLVTIESSDVLFALDSIPAIFGVSQDPFIVFTSNVCAILGLRAMYFLLAAIVERFAYLGIGLGVVLTFIGLKMLLNKIVSIPTSLSLTIIAGAITGAILLSLLRPPKRG